MKKGILKTMLFLMSVSILMCIMIFSASAKTVNSNGFKFDVNGKNATVIEYTGTDSDVKIPSKIENAYVTSIGTEAFWCVKTMKTVTIPSTVTSIGVAAFNECTALTKVVIPYKVTTIGESAFWYCTNLKTVVIPQSVTSIGKNAFKGCNALTAYVTSNSYAEKYIKQQTGITLGYRYMSSITLNKSSTSVAVGSYDRISCTAKPSTVYYKKVTFTSSNPKVAIVNTYGTVKGISCGTAVITVKSADGSNLVKTCTVKVVPDKVTSITLSDVTKTSYTLNWKAVSGAAQYKIYKLNVSAKKWESFAITDKLSCKVSSLTPSSVQYYKVMAFAKVGKYNYCGALSSTFKASTTAYQLPDDTKNLTAKVAHTFVNLAWDKAEGAYGYRIYQYDFVNNKYTFLLATKNLKAQIKNLTPSTKYAFAVRSYKLEDGKTIYSKAVSNIAYCTTRPDYVKDFAVDESSITHNSFALNWTSLKAASGYQIDIYNKESQNYELLCEIDDSGVTEYEIKDLSPLTTYKFKIRAYSALDNTNLYGYTSEEISVTTLQEPMGDDDFFNQFIISYNNTKNTNSSLILFSEKGYDEKSVVADEVSQTDKEEYQKLFDSLFSKKSDTYMFTNGFENSLNKPVTSFITPYDSLTTLKYDMVDTESLSVEEDGSGYRIKFTIKSEDKNAASNSLIAPTINWSDISQGIDRFTLGSCAYNGTVIEAKVNNGVIDEIKFITPLSISFTLNGNPYTLSATSEHEYIFIWQ